MDRLNSIIGQFSLPNSIDKIKEVLKNWSLKLVKIIIEYIQATREELKQKLGDVQLTMPTDI